MREVLLCVEGPDLEVKDGQFEYMKKVLDEVWVKTTVENDGIGPYEFWGQRCNDRGTDYAEATDWDTITVRVLVHGADDNGSLEGGVADVLGELVASRTERIHNSNAFTEIEPKFEKVSEIFKDGNAVLVYEVAWESNGEIS